MSAQAASSLDAARIAGEVIAAIDSARQIPPFTARDPDFDVAQAYAVTAELRKRRIQRGEKQTGRKIGFTNRNIWNEYNVRTPIWGDMYDTTVRDLAASGHISVAQFADPRIEPEIAFKLSADIGPGIDEQGLCNAIEWVAHGFEIVQSIFPDWRFQGADTIAANGFHAALLLGPHQPIAGLHAANLLDTFANFDVTLFCNGKVVDRGKGSNVLGSPLSALHHLVDVLAHDAVNPPLRAGEIITTGTLTRAFPVAAGQVWTTRIDGLALEGLKLAIV